MEKLNCLLCRRESLTPFCTQTSNIPWHLYSPDSARHNQVNFFQCQQCKLIIKDPAVRCNAEQEKRHYEKHNNDLSDPGYREHLLRLVNPMVELIKKDAVGLDYGCGPIISIGALFQEQGIRCDSYDPIFFATENLLKQSSYDFITCCEVVEHFKAPEQEFENLAGMLRPSGKLIISTHTPPDFFEDWWYQRDPTHIVFYSDLTFGWIAHKWGFDLAKLDRNLFLLTKQ
jgi:SAM-dependent methyltransferase